MILGFSAELIVAIASGVIALIALAVAVFEAHAIRKHNKLSVKPLLVIDTESAKIDGKDGGNFYLHNVGFGPAIIKKYALFLDDKEFTMKSYHAANSFSKQFPPEFRCNVLVCPTPDKSIVAVDKKLKFLSIQILEGGYDELNTFAHRLGIKVEYQTIYQDEVCVFIESNHLGHPKGQNTPQEKQKN